MKKLFLTIFLITVSMKIIAWEDLDWLVDYRWYLEDGRDGPDRIDLIGDMAPFVDFYVFNKSEFPFESILYQQRLRNDYFYFLYHTKENQNELFPLKYTYIYDDFFTISFNDTYTKMSRTRGNTPWGSIDRVGNQINSDFPLVGVWGRLPNLNEYHFVDYTDGLFYMEVDKKMPYWAVPAGTYLFKQVDNNSFETISEFSNGKLRLEIIDERLLLLTPLFELPEGEEGLVEPLRVFRFWDRKDHVYETEDDVLIVDAEHHITEQGNISNPDHTDLEIAKDNKFYLFVIIGIAFLLGLILLFIKRHK